MTDFGSIHRWQLLTSINIESLPEEEKPYGNIVWLHFLNLESRVRDFQLALDLIDTYWKEPASPSFGFVHIAARDGALTLWNYSQALNAIKGSLDASPSLRERIRASVIESAKSHFWEIFPDVKGTRDAIGHTSELMKSPQTLEANSPKEGECIFHVGSLLERTYITTTFQGKRAEYEISAATLKKLDKITDLAFSAISPQK